MALHMIVSAQVGVGISSPNNSVFNKSAAGATGSSREAISILAGTTPTKSSYQGNSLPYQNANLNISSSKSDQTFTTNGSDQSFATAAAPILNNALKFNGTNQYVVAPNANIPASGDFTVSVWAKHDPTQNNGTHYYEILSQGTVENAFYIGKNEFGKIRVGQKWESNYNYPTDGNWHNFTVVKTATNTWLYLDGILVETHGSIPNPVTTTFLISHQFAPYEEYFKGSIDEIQIWNRALSACNIEANYDKKLTGQETGLVAYYNFNETGGTTLTDIVGTNKGTLYNSPVWETSGASITGTLPDVVVNTGSVSTITVSSATISGTIDYGTATTRGIVYGTSPCPDISGTKTEETGSFGTGSFSGNLSTLTAGTTYYARAYATNSTGTSYGEVSTFKTLSINPTDISLSSSSVMENSPIKTIIGALSAAPSSGIYSYSFVSGIGDTDNSSFSLKVNSTEDQNSGLGDGAIGVYPSRYTIWQSFTAGLSGPLSFISLRTTNGGNASYTMKLKVYEGEGISGTFLGEATTSTTNVGNGYVNCYFDGITFTKDQQYTFQITNCTPEVGGLFAWGGTDNYTGGHLNYSGYSSTKDFAFKTYIATSMDLVAASSYDFETKSSYTTRIRATNTEGGSLEKAFTITINDLNEAPTNIALSASSTNENVPANSTVGTLSTTDPDAANTFTYTLVSGTGSTNNNAFNIIDSNLRITSSPDFETKNSYSVRIRSTDQGGLFYEKAFVITINDLLEVSTTAISTFDATSATLGGNVTSDGGAIVTERGVVYSIASTNNDPQIGGTGVTKIAIGMGIGNFSQSVGSLAPNTLYYVNAYATNAAGTVYGTVTNFTTLPVAPTVTTQAVTDIATTTATGNGNVTDLGVPNPTQHGVVWGTSANPDITLSTKTTDGAVSITGAFTSAIIDLTPNTTYYVRAYATNAVGTVYGEEVTFTTAIGTGVNEMTDNSLSIYPNPTTDGFNIKTIESAGVVTIYDLNGCLLLTKVLTETYINFSALQPGIYIVKVNEQVRRLIKK